jgi:hypothetical protein
MDAPRPRVRICALISALAMCVRAVLVGIASGKESISLRTKARGVGPPIPSPNSQLFRAAGPYAGLLVTAWQAGQVVRTVTPIGSAQSTSQVRPASSLSSPVSLYKRHSAWRATVRSAASCVKNGMLQRGISRYLTLLSHTRHDGLFIRLNARSELYSSGGG